MADCDRLLSYHMAVNVQQWTRSSHQRKLLVKDLRWRESFVNEQLDTGALSTKQWMSLKTLVLDITTFYTLHSYISMVLLYIILHLDCRI